MARTAVGYRWIATCLELIHLHVGATTQLQKIERHSSCEWIYYADNPEICGFHHKPLKNTVWQEHCGASHYTLRDRNFRTIFKQTCQGVDHREPNLSKSPRHDGPLHASVKTETASFDCLLVLGTENLKWTSQQTLNVWQMTRTQSERLAKVWFLFCA